MKRHPIGTEEAQYLNLHLITYFRRRFGLDLAIFPATNINIGTKEKPVIVNCDIKKYKRNYDHFDWIEKLADKIEEDPGRIVYIVQNEKGERALGVNRVT